MKDGYHPMAPEIGYKPMQALLEKTRDFTAIFCFNDIAAIGAIRALKDAGLTVPAMFPWSDSTTSSPRPTPRRRSPPSASRCWRWASAARRCCSSASPTAKRNSHPKIVMAPELVVRESTGPAKP
jgi:DNA-binding LacI/PurR family transcriptional regulator